MTDLLVACVCNFWHCATRLGTHDIWYAVPLIVVVSLVYAATRHERMVPILVHAVRLALWIAGVMAVIFVVLLLVSWWLSGQAGS